MRDNAGMKPSFLLSWALKLILAVLVLHISAILLYFYVIFPWYDNMMHFLGGFWIALAAMTFLWNFISSQKNPWLRFIFVILCVLLMGIVWEIYEFGVQDWIKITGIASIPDSISDLVFDTLGGIVAFLIINNKTKNLNHE